MLAAESVAAAGVAAARGVGSGAGSGRHGECGPGGLVHRDCNSRLGGYWVVQRAGGESDCGRFVAGVAEGSVSDDTDCIPVPGGTAGTAAADGEGLVMECGPRTA